MTDIRIVDAINDLRGVLVNVDINQGDTDDALQSLFKVCKPSGLTYYRIPVSGGVVFPHAECICEVSYFNHCVQEMSEGLFVPLSDYHKANVSVPEALPFHADTQPLHAVSVDLFNVGDTVYDLTGKPTTVQSDVTIGKYTIGKLCGGSAQLYTTCFSSAEHFQRHEEASKLADYISRKLEWGVVPEGVTLADLQTVKSIIDNGVG